MEVKSSLRAVTGALAIVAISASFSSAANAGEVIGTAASGHENAGLLTVDYVKSETLKKVEALGRAASYNLGIESKETVSVYKYKHRSDANKNLILGGPEVIPM